MVEKIINEIKVRFENDSSGHDWFHIERVWRMANFIQEKEGGDKEIVELAALLHDISDHKMNGGILNHGGTVATEILTKFNLSKDKILRIAEIIDQVSFKGANVSDKPTSLEAKIVQDADRLDAIGAIGIGRAFAYGGSKNRLMYDPAIPPTSHTSFEEYAKSKSHTINHFHEKLLLLKDRLHTETAKNIGKQRELFLKDFLEQFMNEWNFNNLEK